MEREDGEGRLENRIPAPWDRDLGGTEDSREKGRKKSKNEKRNRRRSTKITSKDRIGNIDVNVLQRELCKYILSQWKLNVRYNFQCEVTTYSRRSASLPTPGPTSSPGRW